MDKRVLDVIRALAVVSVLAFFLLLLGPPLFGGYTTAVTGFHAGPYGTSPGAARTVVDKGSPAYAAGLRSGDKPGCMSLQNGEMLYPTFAAPAYSSAPIRVCIGREGTTRSIEFFARPGPPAQSIYGSTFGPALRLFAYFMFLLVGCILVIARPSLLTWLLYVACVATSPSATSAEAFIGWPAAAYSLVPTHVVLSGYLASGLLLLFAVQVPDPNVPRDWRRPVFWTAVIVIVAGLLYDVFLLASGGVAPVDIIEGSTAQFAINAFSWAVVVVTVVRLFTMPRDARARFGWVAFGLIVGVLANALRDSAGGGAITTAFGTLTIVMPLSLMYAVLWQHVIDVRFVISRTVVYGAITTIVIGIIAAVDWLTGQYLSQMRLALAIDAAVTIGIGVALHRSYGMLENAVDVLIYRGKYEAEIYLRRLAKTLLRATHHDTVDRALVDDPYEKLQLSMAALFRRAGESYSVVLAAGWDAPSALAFERDHDIVRFLCAERTQLNIRELRTPATARFIESGAAPAVAIPVFEGDELVAFAVYGLHRNGTRLDPDEIETLEQLCSTAAQAYIRIENLHYRRGLGFSVAPM